MFYKSHVFCCTNERLPRRSAAGINSGAGTALGRERGCCKEKGAEKLRNYMKARVKELGIGGARVNVSGCLDRCDLGPVMVIYPEGVWYTYKSPADVDEIIERHLQKGERVERLLLPDKAS